MSFINPARSIVIGDDCVIGGHCLIFTHSSSLNLFEGYAAEFAPIEIGNRVGLAWRSFVLPGTTIGDGTMVGANSVVSGKIPPSSLAVGFPARIVGRPPVFPKPVSDEEKVEMFRKIVKEMADFLIASGFACKQDGPSYEVCEPKRRWRTARQWRLQVNEADVPNALKELGVRRPDVFLSLSEIATDVRDFLDARNIMWIDIASKAQSRRSNPLGEEVLSYFRRYGVRTLRYPRT